MSRKYRSFGYFIYVPLFVRRPEYRLIAGEYFRPVRLFLAQALGGAPPSSADHRRGASSVPVRVRSARTPSVCRPPEDNGSPSGAGAASADLAGSRRPNEPSSHPADGRRRAGSVAGSRPSPDADWSEIHHGGCSSPHSPPPPITSVAVRRGEHPRESRASIDRRW